MVTPLTVSLDWLACYWRALREGADDQSARLRSYAAAEVKAKEWARCRLRGITLTVPVEGGASVLKRRGADPLISEHGKWRREHLGAWQAIYGRTPYFDHLMPEIEEVYAGSEGITLEQFNSRLFEKAMGWMDLKALGFGDEALGLRLKALGVTEDIEEGERWEDKGEREEREKWEMIGRKKEEIMRKIEPDLSIFDAIFRLGKETSFLAIE